MKTNENSDTGFHDPVKVVAAVIKRDDGRILVARRSSGGIGGDWEFPGGKVEQGETPEAALERELYEELGIRTAAGKFIHTTAFSRSGRCFELSAYYAEIISGEPAPA